MKRLLAAIVISLFAFAVSQATDAKSTLPDPPPATPSASDWEPGLHYKEGALVRFEAATYQCLRTHWSQVGYEPSLARALWSPRAPESALWRNP